MKTTNQASLQLSNTTVTYVSLADIDLDPHNPRFGKRQGGKPKIQAEILDSIVLEYGVEDVISSLAVNGYFPAEPVICLKKKTGRYVVVEGNRRIAACLVLAGDARAKNHSKRTAEYQKLQKSHGRAAITAIPVISFDEGKSPKELISYLGVRHLAASLPWDSYAKAAWIAEVVKDGQLTMEDIAMMTGDKNKTIARLLHGYFVIGQLVETGHFNPEACVKKGRGSNADFAFSWVYTLLGYPTVKAKLRISEDPQPNPIPEDRLQDAGVVFTRLLGNREDKSNFGRPAIEDSREISSYAAALIDDKYFRLIKQGYTLEEAEEELQPANERLSEGINEIERLLSELVAISSKEPPTSTEAAVLLPEVVKLHNLAGTLLKNIIAALSSNMAEQTNG